MAFQFPDPNTTTEFTGDNGVVYAYDATDSKWVVKSSPYQGDYVKRTGGDSMEGPIFVGHNADYSSVRDSRRISALGLFSDSESSALRLGTTRDRIYIGHDDTAFNGLVKIDEIGEKNANNGIKFKNDVLMGINQIKNLAEATDDKDAATKGYVDSVARVPAIQTHYMFYTDSTSEISTGTGMYFLNDTTLIYRKTIAGEDLPELKVGDQFAVIKPDGDVVRVQVTQRTGLISGFFQFVVNSLTPGITLGTNDKGTPYMINLVLY